MSSFAKESPLGSYKDDARTSTGRAGLDAAESSNAFDAVEINRLLAENQKRDRGYASYGQWPLDKTMAERDHARVLLLTLAAIRGQAVASLVSRGTDDPPDCTAEMADGFRVGIEITELVSGEMIERHQRRERAVRAGRQPPDDAVEPGDIAWWTPMRSSLNYNG